MQKTLYALILAGLFSLAGYAQTAAPTVPPVKPDDDDTIKISTALVQIDATVMDKAGNIVTDLKPEDFEIYANGKKQEITNFSLINGQKTVNWVSAAKNAPAAPLPPIVSPEQVRRTIAVVIDDLGLSAESLVFSKQAIKKYVGDQIQPGDLVAVISTSKGIGTTLRFTNDRRLLDAALDTILYNFRSREGLWGTSSFGAPSVDKGSRMTGTAAPPTSDRDIGLMGNELQRRTDAADADSIQNLRYGVASRETLSSLIYIINGMRTMPGRKSLMFFSDGIAFLGRNASESPVNPLIYASLQRVVDSATRAGVVINSIDAKGLEPLGLTAADSSNVRMIDKQVQDRRESFRERTDGLRKLAEDSGGQTFADNNDLNLGIVKTLGEQTDYYLIGYQPDADAFNQSKPDFTKIEIKLKRPNLKVRYKNGFFSVADEAKLTTTAAQQTLAALKSPFIASDINLRLNTMFNNDDKTGIYARSLLHINAKDLNFTVDADGKHNASLDVYMVSYDSGGKVVDQSQKNYKFSVEDKIFQKKMAEGFVYEFVLPVKKAGVYETRVVVRDTATARLGSAFQTVAIPDLTKNKLALSSIFVSSQDAADKQSADEAQAQQVNVLAHRQFKKGSVLSYGIELYNGDSKQSQLSQLQTQVKILRAGKTVLEGQLTPLQTNNQPDLKKIGISGALELGRQLSAGAYVLQFSVINNSAKDKEKYTTQEIQFEITE